MDQYGSWLIYGVNGYTGRRIAEEAVARHWRPVVAGRNADRVAPVAESLGCRWRAFELNDQATIAANLADVDLVLNCAGPFSATARPMIEACLAAKAHYLDITGEIDVIEHAAEWGDRAEVAEVVLIPAVGFDVVPSDCLAAMLHERLPKAQTLRLAFTGTGRVSRGTARTMLENLPRGGRVRIDGRIERVPTAWKTAEIPFSTGRRTAVTIPWGDVASAYYSTGVPNIEVYMAMDEQSIAWMRRTRALVGLLKWIRPKSLAERIVRGFVGDGGMGAGRSSLWAEMVDEQGKSIEATLDTLDGYTLTVHTALAAVEKVVGGKIAPGFATPSKAFGAEFICSMPDSIVQWPQQSG